MKQALEAVIFTWTKEKEKLEAQMICSGTIRDHAFLDPMKYAEESEEEDEEDEEGEGGDEGDNDDDDAQGEEQAGLS